MQEISANSDEVIVQIEYWGAQIKHAQYMYLYDAEIVKMYRTSPSMPAAKVQDWIAGCVKAPELLISQKIWRQDHA